MKVKQTISMVLVGIVVLAVFALIAGGFGKNNDQNWQIIQSVTGNISVRSTAGWYLRKFATVTTYPRYIEYTYNDNPDEGAKALESMSVTFNDGGKADISTLIRISTPLLEADRKEFHRQFGGSLKNIKAAVKAHKINCLKASAPLMSSSENQSARKAEFNQIVEDQLVKGLYVMRKVEKELKDRTDEKGRPITVFATEIVTDKNGMPRVAKFSPLTENYKIGITQFSITETAYDKETLEQFSAKKKSFLAAEKSKAEREQEVQQRLMVIEKGLREKAEVEAEANKKMATAVIAAQLKANVAIQTKIAAETKANEKLSVAEINKDEALMIASKKLEVAQIEALAAVEDKKAMISRAQGRKEAIQLSGDITELEQAMIDAEVQKATAVAEALAKIKVPTTMFIGGNEGGNSTMENLINLKLMEATGILDATKVNTSKVERKITRTTK